MTIRYAEFDREMRFRRFWLATPTWGGMDAAYCRSLFKTLEVFSDRRWLTPDYAVGEASEIPNLHAMLDAMMAAPHRGRGIFWVGHDHSWEPEDFVRILQAAMERPEAVIGAMYPISNGKGLVGAAETPVDPAQDLVPAHYVGWGFTWTPLSAFERMKPPFWEWSYRTDPATGRDHIVSPDVYFSEKARAAGVEVLIHRKVVDVGHGVRGPHLTALDLMKREGKA